MPKEIQDHEKEMERPRPRCWYCKTTIRKADPQETFLMPRPRGAARRTTMHRDCLAAFNRLAVRPEFSEVFFSKAIV